MLKKILIRCTVIAICFFVIHTASAYDPCLDNQMVTHSRALLNRMKDCSNSNRNSSYQDGDLWRFRSLHQQNGDYGQNENYQQLFHSNHLRHRVLALGNQSHASNRRNRIREALVSYQTMGEMMSELRKSTRNKIMLDEMERYYMAVGQEIMSHMNRNKINEMMYSLPSSYQYPRQANSPSKIAPGIILETQTSNPFTKKKKAEQTNK